MAPPIRLPQERNRASPLAQSWTRLKQVRGLRDLARWSTRSFRLAQLPLRIRPAMILGTFLALLVLSLLGFHPTLATHLAPRAVPFSDKVLHFVCFGVATALFYACWVVEESARRVAFWRYWNEAVSLVGFTLVGGIGSEFVQALLPYKTFQLGDVVANVLGSALAVLLMHHRARKARHAAEIRRLYVHLDQIDPEDDDDDDDYDDEEDEQEEEEAAVAGSGAAQRGLLRHQREMQESRRSGRAGAGGGKTRTARVVAALDTDEHLVDGGGGPPPPASSAAPPRRPAAGRRKQALDPWSATDDEIFGLGDDEEDDDDHGDHTARGSSPAPRTAGPL